MSETDPWQPEAIRTGTAPAITSEMIRTASMVIQRMYSSDDPGEVQSGRAVVQALYPLIAAAERRRIAAQPCTNPACPVRWCSHGPDERCFDCATDGDLIAAIPDWPGSEAGRMAAEPRKD